jgi:hypothetical protein
MEENQKLLTIYKQLWNNRSLVSSDVKEKEVLHKAILIELNDELTHPRTRKRPVDKYVMAIKRITNSTIDATEQIQLIKEFTRVFDEIK